MGCFHTFRGGQNCFMPNGLFFQHGYGANVPESIQDEGKRLKALVEQCGVGPYAEPKIKMAVYLFGEGMIEPAFKTKGIRSYKPKPNGSTLVVVASIYMGKENWALPLDSYRKVLWANFRQAAMICAEKLGKQKIEIDAARLNEDLSNIENKYLGASSSPSEALAMPVDQYADDEEQRLIVQYRIEGHGRDTDHDKRVGVENLLGEFLEEAELGYCDGGDIGSGTMNVFCFVKPSQEAGKKTIDVLRKNNLLEGATIVETVKGEERVIWPPDFKGDFQLIYR